MPKVPCLLVPRLFGAAAMVLAAASASAGTPAEKPRRIVSMNPCADELLLRLAERFCDRLMVIEKGRVRADDRPDLALTDNTLRGVFGIGALRGTHADGTRYVVPWQRLGA